MTGSRKSTPGRTRLRRARVFAAALALYAVLGGGVAGQTAGGEEVYDVRANRMSLKEIGGEKVLELSDGVTIVHDDVTVTSRRGIHYNRRRITYLLGDVHIVQEDMRMWGDEGEYREPTDLAVLRKNVRIVDEGWEITCDEARYNRETGRAWLRGNIVARDSTTTLYADSLFYERENQLAEALGRVRLSNLEEGFVVEGRHGFYDREHRIGIVDRDPHLVVDPDSREPVTIDSDTMRVYPDENQALAYYRVKIIKGNTVTQCDSAVLYDEQNRAELYGNPLAKEDEISMKGNEMLLFYDDDEVHRIDIEGAAEIYEENRDTLVVGRDNWIRGDTMSLYIHENHVDSIRVLRNAVSEYYPVARNRVESNFVRGDSMFFHFVRDSLDYVRIEGEADGVYKYVDLSDGETTDSLRSLVDTTLVYRPFAEEAEKVVYSARRIEYFATTKDLVLREKAKVRYQNRTLSGEDITYFSKYQMLDARGEPKLVDAGETFYGERMDYDLDAGSGLVHKGSTQFQEGFYFGEDVAKVGDNEMKVWNSTYTTCDLKVPHYHFGAKEMKVYPNDKVVSGPIWLYVGKTPIAFLPFLANSIQRGRRSGILRPEFEFGITKRTGRYVRNFGYYWATNDYTDFTFIGDFNEDASFRGHVGNRYRLRYAFNGDVNFDFLRDLSTYTNRWTIDARHNHNLGEKFTLTSDLHFVSDEQARRDISRIDDVQRVIDRSIRSNVSLRKSWEKVSFSASASRTQNLDITDPNDAKVTMTAPKISLSIPSRTLYPGGPGQGRNESLAERVLGSIRYSPGLSGTRTTTEKEFVLNETITSNQSLSFSSPQKVWFLSVQPRLQMRNLYTHEVSETLSHVENDTIPIPYNRVVEDDNRFTWSTGASVNTNFYGTFYPTIGRLRGVQHVISPSATYSYTPEIEGRPRVQRIGVNLRNSIDLKIATPQRKGGVEGGAAGVSSAKPPESGTEEEQTQKLSGVVFWTLSSSYNPDAPHKKGWSTISSNVNTTIFGTNVSLNQSIQPYDFEVLSTRITSGLSLSGTHPFGRSEEVTVRELNVVAAADTGGEDEGQSGATYELIGDDEQPLEQPDALAIEEGRLPWSVSMNFSYTKTRSGDARSTMDLRGEIELTKAWRISYWTSYDVEDRVFRGQNYRVTRDLHCWEMSFSRQLLGNEWQYYFKINLRAHPDVYAESGRRGLGGFGGGLTSGGLFR